MPTLRGFLIEGVGQNLLRNSLLTGADPLTNWAAKISGTRISTTSVLGTVDGASAWELTATSQRPCFISEALALTDNTFYVLSFWLESFSLTGGNNVVAHITGAGTGATGIDLISTALPTALPAVVAYCFKTGTGAGAATASIGLGCLDVATGTMTFSRPQLEIGRTCTSFMAGGANVRGARAADITTKALSTFPYNQSQGSIIAEFRAPKMFGAESVIVQTDDTTENNRMSLLIDTSGHIVLNVTNGGIDDLTIDGGAITPDAIHRAAFRYAQDDFALSVDGQAPGGGTIPPPPTADIAYPPFWGTGLRSSSLGEMHITGMGAVGMRFRAWKTGTITNVRWFIRMTSPIYSEGDGGRIRTSIQPIASDGYPTGVNLGSCAILEALNTQFPGRTSYFPLETFSPPVAVVKNQRYCVVWDNLHADPVNNYVSVDVLNWSPATQPLFPYQPDSDSVMMRAAAKSPRYDRIPSTIALQYDDGFIQGGGGMAGYMDSATHASPGDWDGLVTTTQWARQTFTPDRTFTATALGLNYVKVAGTGNLTAVIKQGTSTIATVTFTAAQSPTGSAFSNADWVESPISPNITFQSGTAYSFELRGSSGTTYKIQGLQDGSGSWGYAQGSYSTVIGQAWKSTDSGANWSGWVLYSNTRNDVDLPFFFRTT